MKHKQFLKLVAYEMRSFSIKISLNKFITPWIFKALIAFIILGCSSTKKIKQKNNLLVSYQNATQVHDRNDNIATDYAFDNHNNTKELSELTSAPLSKINDSLTQTLNGTEENKIELEAILAEEFTYSNIIDIKSPVADKIVENYLNSENKEPNGDCLSVSKGRFEQAYKEVYGHSLYHDLPDSMASKFYTPKQVFNLLYASASDNSQGWCSLPEKYRGKGNAGAITYAGMGTLVDSEGIWNGQLRPGALVQVWWYKEDYEKVVEGVNVKKLDPYGHSFIFISYVRNENNEITGLKIADQGFQSYRPLTPRDYQVWWAVNLNI
jgi:hypothetical protein